MDVVGQRIADALLVLAVLVPSVILHEVAHGVVALRFGDDTARRAGRLTLNPARHVDPFGSLILPAVLAMTGAGAFGYARPVPVNVSRLRSPRNHGLLVSLAGPATNILLAVLGGLALRWVIGTPEGQLALLEGALAPRLLVLFGTTNVVLAAFNLLPLPPLDGSAVVGRFLPQRLLPAWFRLRRWSMPILLGVVLLLPGAFSRVFQWALRLWAAVLL